MLEGSTEERKDIHPRTHSTSSRESSGIHVVTALRMALSPQEAALPTQPPSPPRSGSRVSRQLQGQHQAAGSLRGSPELLRGHHPAQEWPAPWPSLSTGSFPTSKPKPTRLAHRNPGHSLPATALRLLLYSHTSRRLFITCQTPHALLTPSVTPHHGLLDQTTRFWPPLPITRLPLVSGLLPRLPDVPSCWLSPAASLLPSADMLVPLRVRLSAPLLWLRDHLHTQNQTFTSTQVLPISRHLHPRTWPPATAQTPKSRTNSSPSPLPSPSCNPGLIPSPSLLLESP